MAAILWTIAAVLVVAAAIVLLTPVHVWLDASLGSGRGAPGVRTRVRFGGRGERGDVEDVEKNVEGDADGTGAARTSEARRDDARARRRRGNPGRAWRRLRVAIGRADFRARVLRLARAAFRVASPDRLHVRARIGFDDPADTGLVYGLIAGLGAAVPHVRRDWHVEVEPSWMEPALEADAELRWSVRPISVLGPIAAFVLSPVTMRTAVAVWRTR